MSGSGQDYTISGDDEWLKITTSSYTIGGICNHVATKVGVRAKILFDRGISCLDIPLPKHRHARFLEIFENYLRHAKSVKLFAAAARELGATKVTICSEDIPLHLTKLEAFYPAGDGEPKLAGSLDPNEWLIWINLLKIDLRIPDRAVADHLGVCSATFSSPEVALKLFPLIKSRLDGCKL